MSTPQYASKARIVEAPSLASVSTTKIVTAVRNVEALTSVSTGDDAADARIVEAPASVNTGDDATNARIVFHVIVRKEGSVPRVMRGSPWIASRESKSHAWNASTRRRGSLPLPLTHMAHILSIADDHIHVLMI